MTKELSQIIYWNWYQNKAHLVESSYDAGPTLTDSAIGDVYVSYCGMKQDSFYLENTGHPEIGLFSEILDKKPICEKCMENLLIKLIDEEKNGNENRHGMGY